MLNIIAFVPVLILIAVIDIKKRIIPNEIIYPAALAALVFSLFNGIGLWAAVVSSLACIGMCMVMVFGVGGGLGFGDVKLAGLIGMIIPFPLSILALLASYLIAIIYVCIQDKGEVAKKGIPFAPFMAGSAIFFLLAGATLVSWYANAYL